jgi:eukaryotic-like serine/threonine-protein kinase
MTVILDRLATALADRYRVERELGAGGMATVYLAHDLRHERWVAIKVLRPELGAVIGAERFLREIRTIAGLQHAHILGLIDSGELDGTAYYVMPFVDGESLRDRLQREKQLPIAEALRIATEVGAGLDYAHRHGVIHRDIKPENILLHDGSALIADFGIALAVSTAGGGRMTETGLSLGTPHYMSPEQAMGERDITARSDVYALGAITYEMLLGEPPFTGPTAQAIVARVLTEKPASLTQRRERVPAHVEEAVHTALEKLPADRWESAGEFVAALQGRVAANGTFPNHRRPATTLWPGAPRASVVRVAALVTLLAAGVAAVWVAAKPLRVDPAGDAWTVTSILAPATGNFAAQRSLALTPDGRRLAFVFAADDGTRSLWLRDLARPNAEPIPHTTGAHAPFWSPDGRSLGFFAAGHLNVIDANGAARRLCPAAGAGSGSWSESGVILFSHRNGIVTVPAAGGDCRALDTGETGPIFMVAFLPGGRRFLYSRGRHLDMIAADLDGNVLDSLPVRTMEFAVVEPGYLLFGSRADEVAVDAQRIDLRRLTLNGPVVRVASNVRYANAVHTIAVSASGTLAFLPSSLDQPYLEYDANGMLRDTVRVAGTWTMNPRALAAGPPLVAVGGGGVGIWLYDLDSDRATRLVVRDADASGVRFGNLNPVFSSDGARLVFASNSSDRCRIIERVLSTEVDRVVRSEPTMGPGQCTAPLDWSADGRTLLARRDTALVLIPLDGADPVARIERPGRLWDGRFSPNGRAVAYSSDETGRPEVYVQALPTGPAVRVSREGGRWPFWTHAGTRLTFLTPDGRVQEAPLDPNLVNPPGTPYTRFAVPTWRRSDFDDVGTGFAVLGNGERYIVRKSPAGIAVAYMQNWPSLFRGAVESRASR